MKKIPKIVCSSLWCVLVMIQLVYVYHMYGGVYNIFILIGIEFLMFIIHSFEPNKLTILLQWLAVLIISCVIVVLQPRYNRYEIWNLIEKEATERNLTEVNTLYDIQSTRRNILYSKVYYCQAKDSSGKNVYIYGDPEDGMIYIRTQYGLYDDYIQNSETTIKNTFEHTAENLIEEYANNSKEVILKTYYELSDGTWEAEEQNYQYRLILTGRLKNAEKNITYTILSNDKSITFEQAWKASGLSSNMDDYFKVEDAVIVATTFLE